MSLPVATRFPSAFKRLAWSNLAAQSAEQISLAAAPIVAVLALGAGGGETGILQTAQTLPFLIFSIPVGVLADRMSRRNLMASAEALRAVSLAGILVLGALGALTLPLLAILGFIGACGTIAYSIAAPALVPALVSGTALASANGRIELARTIAFAAGPALAGALIGWIGASIAFAVATALSTGAVFLLSGIKEPPRPAVSPRHPLHELREGASFVFRHPLLLPIFSTQVIFNTAFFILLAVYVPYAIHQLGLSASGVGTTLGTYGLGMVVGALLAPRIIRTMHFGTVIAIGPIMGLTAAVVMVSTIWIPSFFLAALSFFLVGAGPLVWTVSTTTLRQTVTPRDLLGRVSAMSILASGARSIGALVGAVLSATYGEATCIVVAAIVFLMQAIVILTSPVLSLMRPPEMATP